MVDRLEYFHCNLKAQGILPDDLLLTFEDEDTCYMPFVKIINFNPDIDFLDPDEEEELSKITCGNNKTFLEKFTPQEITYFHEVGHFLDFQKNKITESEVLEIIAIRTDAMNKVEFYSNAILDRCETEEQEDIALNIMRKADFAFYRNLPLEINADKNAQVLMRYILSNFSL